MGTTEYSAKPAIEYIAIADPSFAEYNLVFPSYKVPYKNYNKIIFSFDLCNQMKVFKNTTTNL